MANQRGWEGTAWNALSHSEQLLAFSGGKDLSDAYSLLKNYSCLVPEQSAPHKYVNKAQRAQKRWGMSITTVGGRKAGRVGDGTGGRWSAAESNMAFQYFFNERTFRGFQGVLLQRVKGREEYYGKTGACGPVLGKKKDSEPLVIKNKN